MTESDIPNMTFFSFILALGTYQERAKIDFSVAYNVIQSLASYSNSEWSDLSNVLGKNLGKTGKTGGKVRKTGENWGKLGNFQNKLQIFTATGSVTESNEVSPIMLKQLLPGILQVTEAPANLHG